MGRELPQCGCGADHLPHMPCGNRLVADRRTVGRGAFQPGWGWVVSRGGECRRHPVWTKTCTDWNRISSNPLCGRLPRPARKAGKGNVFPFMPPVAQSGEWRFRRALRRRWKTRDSSAVTAPGCRSGSCGWKRMASLFSGLNAKNAFCRSKGRFLPRWRHGSGCARQGGIRGGMPPRLASPRRKSRGS